MGIWVKHAWFSVPGINLSGYLLDLIVDTLATEYSPF